MKIKKNLIALSILSIFGMQAYAQTNANSNMNNANNANGVNNSSLNTHTETNRANMTHSNTMNNRTDNKTEVPGTTRLDKKVVKEEEKTQESLQKGKINANQASTLNTNESNIAKELSDSKQDGDVTRDEKKQIKKDLKDNKDMRKDMEKSNKEVYKAR